MKLFKKVMSVLTLLFVVFAMTGCGGIFGGKTVVDLDGPEPPAISDTSDSYTLHYGESKTLSVTAAATDGGSLSYQWYKGTSNREENATLISGATGTSYKIDAPEYEVPKTYYWCKVTNTKNGKTADGWTYSYDVTVTNVITFDGEEINTNTTWNSKYTYYVKDWVVVKASLTIPKGTVVKFKNGAYMETSDSGMIKVEGSVTDEKKEYVYFTSYLDHSVGITIPDFADSAATADKGDWGGVYINAENASKIQYAVFRYSNVALQLNNEKINTVENCIFIDNKSNNIADKPSAALEIKGDANESIVKNNIFYNNDWPLKVSANYTVDTSNIFHNPEDENIKNVHQAIVMEAGKTIEKKNISWNVTELPYYATDSDWIYVKGHTLSIGDDVVVKFNSGMYLEIEKTGNLELGTNSILTCWKDNDHGEDIWAGEDVGDVEWGDWEGVRMNSYDPKVYDNPINTDKTRVWYNRTSNYETNDDE